jgi:hypothetical protein
LNPPIKHRDESDVDSQLTPFEFAVAIGLIDARAVALADLRHKDALAAGAMAMDAEKARADDFKEDWRETKRRRLRGETVPSRRECISTTLPDLDINRTRFQRR